MLKDACRYALGKHANIVVLTPLELDELTIDNGSLVAFDTRALDCVSKLQRLVKGGEVFLLPYEPDDLSEVVEQVSKFRETAQPGFVGISVKASQSVCLCFHQ